MTVVRSHSAKNTPIAINPPINKTKTKQKDKGIKLTHYSSLNSIKVNIRSPKLIIKTQDTTNNSGVNLNKTYSSNVADSIHKNSAKKIFVTKKCLDYKNKKVMEHKMNPELNYKPYLRLQ